MIFAVKFDLVAVTDKSSQLNYLVEIHIIKLHTWYSSGKPIYEVKFNEVIPQANVCLHVFTNLQHSYHIDANLPMAFRFLFVRLLQRARN